MEKNFDEPEEFLEQDYTPFDEAVNEKSYTKPNVKFKAEDIAGDIPEPDFNPPPLDAEVDNPTPKQSQPKKKPIEHEPINPKMEDLSEKDKNKSAEHMAKMIVDGYALVCSNANRLMMFSKKKMMKLSKDGEVDFSVQIPYDLEGNTISGGEFIEEYNSQQEGALNVSNEFREEIMPPLTRELKKRGMGLTDMQKIGFILAKDVIQKGAMIYGAIGTMKEMTNSLKEMTEAMKQGGYNSDTIPKKPKTPTPPPSDPIFSPEPTDIVDEQVSNDFEESINVDNFEPVYNANTDLNMDLEDKVEAQISPEYRENMKKSSIAIVKPKGVAPRSKRGSPKTKK